MIVQIIKAGRSTYWYADKIGEQFEVRMQTDDEEDSVSDECVTDYRVVNDPSCLIGIDDCEVIESN